jgi:hypothetical protein
MFHCYSAHPFTNANSELSPFCYSAQSFYDFVSHSQDHVRHFATLLGHFMILSAILEILPVILYNAQPFHKIALSFPSFRQSFYKMTNAGLWGRRQLTGARD